MLLFSRRRSCPLLLYSNLCRLVWGLLFFFFVGGGRGEAQERKAGRQKGEASAPEKKARGQRGKKRDPKKKRGPKGRSEARSGQVRGRGKKPGARRGKIHPGIRAFRAGIEAMRGKDAFRAKALLQKAARHLPHWGVIRLELARAIRQSGGRPQEVWAQLKLALRYEPTNPRVLYEAGFFFEGQRKNKKAFHFYRRSVRRGGYHHHAHLRLALLLQKKDPAQALRYLEQASRRYDSSFLIHFHLYRLYEGRGKLERAERSLRRLIWLSKDDPYQWKRLIAFYKRHLPQLKKRALRRQWRRSLKKARRRLSKLLLPQRRRKLRPLKRSKK